MTVLTNNAHPEGVFQCYSQYGVIGTAPDDGTIIFWLRKHVQTGNCGGLVDEFCVLLGREEIMFKRSLLLVVKISVQYQFKVDF